MAQAPRPYHLVVLSDHGQTQGAPFRQRYDETLEDLVKGALAQGEVHAPAAVDEAWGDVGAVLADARQDPGLGGRVLARATRSRDGRGNGRAGAEPRGAGGTQQLEATPTRSDARTRSAPSPPSHGEPAGRPTQSRRRW